MSYCAPEIKANIENENYDKPIDLCKSLAFSLGKMLSETCFEEKITKYIKPIIQKLMHVKPKERISVEEGLNLLKNIK